MVSRQFLKAAKIMKTRLTRLRSGEAGQPPSTRKSLTLRLPVLLFSLLVLLLPRGAVAQDVTRTLFTPPVVPETQTNPVRLEATVSGSPSSVVFTYNNADRPMFDNG